MPRSSPTPFGCRSALPLLSSPRHRFDDPNMVELQKIEDPYFYFDRLTMPKLVVNAVGDEFQQPDDTKNWWSDLPEPKHFLMVPNAEHSLATGIFEVVPAIGTWITKLLAKEEVPKFTWDIDKDSGDITVDLSGVSGVKKVEKFYGLSVNDIRRDFRFVNIDDPCPMGLSKDGTCLNLRSFWKSEELQPTGGGVYVASHEAPKDGRWAAFMIQVTFEKDEEEEEGNQGAGRGGRGGQGRGARGGEHGGVHPSREEGGARVHDGSQRRAGCYAVRRLLHGDVRAQFGVKTDKRRSIL